MIRGLNKLTATCGLGYVMSSYTAHRNLQQAELDARNVAADLMSAGLVVYAPIAYGPVIERVLLEGESCPYIQSHEFWMPACERFLRRCDYGILATTPNWHKSTGIAVEIGAMIALNMPVWLYDFAEKAIFTVEEASAKWPEKIHDLMLLAVESFEKNLVTKIDDERSKEWAINKIIDQLRVK